MQNPRTVLIVEDDPDIADVVTVNLKYLGLESERAADGEAGLGMALENRYALIVLDLMLPRLDGLSVCTRLRAAGVKTPILMLTARSEEPDRIIGLELGADDYVTKPFSVRELSARVKALLRRAELDRRERRDGGADGRIEIGELSVDLGKRSVRRAGEAVELTAKEFDLLALFVRNPGRVYSRTDLLNLVWGYGFEGYEHTVNTHINRLRGKIERNPGSPVYLLTVWGVGYRFSEPDERAR